MYIEKLFSLFKKYRKKVLIFIVIAFIVGVGADIMEKRSPRAQQARSCVEHSDIVMQEVGGIESISFREWRYSDVESPYHVFFYVVKGKNGSRLVRVKIERGTEECIVTVEMKLSYQ